MRTVLLVDGNTLQWRAAYSFGESRVTQGVLSYLFQLIEKSNPEKVVIFWDISKSRWRQEVYPEYKAGRSDKRGDLDIEEIYDQVRLAKRLINLLGIRQIAINGVEADDLLAWFSEYFYSTLRDYRIVISTVDKDLWQLINDRVLILDFKTNIFINGEYVLEEFGVPSHLIPDFKSLSGDSSDNIPGIKGIGDKKAISYIQEYGSLSGMKESKNFAALMKSKVSAKILENFSEAEVFYRLTKLPKLQDMKLLLNSYEIDQLKEAITSVVVPDSMGRHLLRDFISAGVRVPQGDYSTKPHEFEGMLKMLEPVEVSADSLEELDLRVKGCYSCQLRGYCSGYGPVLPAGVVGSDVMIIGGCPSAADLLSGVPFSDEDGSFLGRFLETVGLDRSDCWVTTVCKCVSGDRAITQPEILQCVSYLKKEIEIIQPKFIVAFGNEAMSAVLPYGSGLTKYVGQIFKGSQGLVGKVDSWVAVLPHPTYALRSKRALAEFEYGTEMVKEFLEKRRCEND